MSKERDAGREGGRLLFADFDASAKDRPPAVGDVGTYPAGILEARLSTLEELANSLEFAFEDDGVAAANPPPAFAFPRNSLPAAGPPPAGGGGDPAALPESPVQAPAPAHPAPPPHRYGYAGWRGYEGRGRQPETFAPPAPAAFPPDGPGSGGAAPTEGSAAALAEPDADEELDILAVVAPPGIAAPPAEEWRVQRPVTPSRPYGGLARVENWYQPPEEADRFHPTPDWYEPPEPAPEGDRAAAVEYGAAAPKHFTRRFASEESFSADFLDARWEEKIHLAHADREFAAATAGGAEMDPFSDFDFESAWEKNVQRDKETPARPDSAGLADTVILKRPSLDDGATAIIPLSDLRDPRPDASRSGARRPSPPDAAKMPEPPPKPGGAVPHFFDVETHAAGRAAGGQATAPSRKRGPSPETGREAPAAGDAELDLGELVFEDAEESGAAAGDDSANRRQTGLPDGIADDPELFLRLREAEAEAASEEAAENETERREEANEDAPDAAGAEITAPVVADSDIRQIPASEEDSESFSEGEEAEVAGPEDGDGVLSEADELAEGTEESPSRDPLDVLSNLEDVDFSDDGGLDDEMRAMLDDEEEKPETAQPDAAQPVPEAVPAGFAGRLAFMARKALGRVIPAGWLSRLLAMVAWRENGWFYCDLLAAVIASASLAVIVSYFLWYR